MALQIMTDPVQITVISQPYTGDGATGLWVDPKVWHTINIPMSAFTAFAIEVARQMNLRDYSPASLVPGSGGLVTMPNGQILTIGVNGEVYLDGVQLPGVAARQIVRFGVSIYAQGKTVPTWWRWNGAAWVFVANFDPTILKDLPAP